MSQTATSHLDAYLPDALREVEDPQTAIPAIAKDSVRMREIEEAVRRLPSRNQLYCADARDLSFIPAESVHLIVTSPPYWTLKAYRDGDGQLGHIDDYEIFLQELDHVWRGCYEALVPGGRLVCVVGDVCISRRKNNGRHMVMPLHASIQERCRALGFDNLAPIIWYKIANAVYEVDNGGGFLGKPYEPNAVVKNDIEFLLMQRKAGGYRKPELTARLLSIISEQNHREWFQQIWTNLTGASTRNHPAPYPVELTERLIRMFSFVGDTILDPFMGTGSTAIAASRCGRNSINVELDPHYFQQAVKRIERDTAGLFERPEVDVYPAGP